MLMSGKHRRLSRWRRGPRPGHRVPKPRWSLTEMMDGDDMAHLVTSDAFAAGLRDGTGRYHMLCGRCITVGSMAARPNRYCRPCSVLETWT